jgi:flavin reductase (DIM6/NTAB) family NADH-FMN oxidoreductase RutF
VTALRDEQAHQCVVSHLDHPMFIVTVASDEQPAGCLVGFATQCSQRPPRWFVGISKLNHTFAIAATASVVVVHALGADHVALARLFGELTGDNIDKFAHCQWRPGPDGRTPVLDECRRWFAGEIVDRVDPGDHLALVLAPFAAECGDHSSQLGMQALPDLDPGHPS